MSVTKVCQHSRVVHKGQKLGDAIKKQQTVSGLARCLTKPPWISSQVSTHSGPPAAVTSVRIWFYSSAYILFNHNQWSPHCNLTLACFSTQIHSERVYLCAVGRAFLCSRKGYSAIFIREESGRHSQITTTKSAGKFENVEPSLY